VSGFKIAEELISHALVLFFYNGRNGRDKQGAFSVCQICQVNDLIVGQWSPPRDLVDGMYGP
jgi:hypothetical protein